MTKAVELASEHWAWLESILIKELEMKRKLFIDGFIHGYGHRQKEELKEGNNVRD